MQDDNDELRRSPGTPVFTAPECCLGWGSLLLENLFSIIKIMQDIRNIYRACDFSCLLTGLTYHGKAADTWAVGVTLYCMVLGQYPFLGESLQDTYDKVCLPQALPFFLGTILLP